MENIILIFLCLLVGFVLQRVKDFPANSYKTLNLFVIYIALPALSLYYIPKIDLSIKLLYPIGIAWIGFLIAFLFFSLLGNTLGWSRKLIGCLTLTAGLGNTSFVGFPIIETLFGKKGLETAIIVDQPGSFVVLSTLAIVVASLYSNKEVSFPILIKKIAYFPPFITFLMACAMNICGFDFSDVMQLVFQKLGATVTPVALLAVGLQLKFDRNSKHWQFLGLGLFFKLMLMPAFFYILYVLLLHQHSEMIQISITESAMAPMITGAILASTYGLKPKLSSMMVGFGIPISFITIAFWHWFLLTF